MAQTAAYSHDRQRSRRRELAIWLCAATAFVAFLTVITVWRQRQARLDVELRGAVEAKAAAQVLRLLHSGADPNARPAYRIFGGGDTVLTSAARGNDMAVIRALIDHGADVNAVDGSGMTALMYAAQGNAADVVELLLRHGADAKAHATGWSALQWAVYTHPSGSQPPADPKVIELLRQAERRR